jgi:cytidyltransferase-like protein
MKIVLVTGGFDPLHSGHIEYFKAAKQLGNLLVVGINSDEWLARKKGKAFMNAVERKSIIENLYQVHKVIEFNDNDGSAIDAIRRVKEMFPRDKIVFANGGDRTKDNIPEMVFEDVEFVFGVGGTTKANSSSWILEEWKAPKTVRPWGYYRVLHDVYRTKVKELTVEPGESLSMQRHRLRNEYWLVTSGQCLVESMMPNGYLLPPRELGLHDSIRIPLGDWHKLSNPYEEPCRIVEIQYGTSCDESDIERR